MAIDQGGPDAGPLASTDYHRVSARVLEIANKLRALGVDSVLQVPTLVIAGDQSSGKSSVVEAIAGVPLPRSDGTCTRCPTEVRMRTQAANADLASDMESSGGGEDGSGMEEDGEGAANGADGKRRPAWRCRIKLCRDYDSEDKPLAEKPPEQPFCVVRDKAHIAACVSAAQAVLLNPRAVEAAAGGPQAFVPELSSAQPGRRPAESATLRSLGDATRYELAFTSKQGGAGDRRRRGGPDHHRPAWHHPRPPQGPPPGGGGGAHD